MKRILHLSTHNEDCGVGKYQEQFLESMTNDPDVENKFFEYSPNQIKRMSADEQADVFKKLKAELKDYDILHVQHEFAFYPHHEFNTLCSVARDAGKKLIITYHTSPDDAIFEPKLSSYHPRSFIHYARVFRHRKNMLANHVAAARTADAIIVHNKHSVNTLVEFGVPAEKIHLLQMPVPVHHSYSDKATEIKEGLNTKQNDIVLFTVGFMHKYKGLFDAVKALRFLPEQYKLAILGGVNPESADIKIYNKICDLINELELNDRVYITGYVKDDDALNKLIQACDIAIYPYDPTYYAHVSSAALNLAFANYMPMVAYPVGTFIEIAEQSQAIILTNGFSYYELARSVKVADSKILSERAAKYAAENSYPIIAKELITIYQSV